MNKKFNIIDFIIIMVVVIAIILLGVFYINSRKNDTVIHNTNNIKLNFVVEVANLTEDNANMYKAGQTVSFDEFGNCKGVIQNVIIEPYKVWTKNTEVGEVLISEVPNKYTAKLTIQTDVVKEANKYSCNNERISIGKSLPIKVKGAACEACYIVDLYEVKWGVW